MLGHKFCHVRFHHLCRKFPQLRFVRSARRFGAVPVTKFVAVTQILGSVMCGILADSSVRCIGDTYDVFSFLPCLLPVPCLSRTVFPSVCSLRQLVPANLRALQVAGGTQMACAINMTNGVTCWGTLHSRFAVVSMAREVCFAHLCDSQLNHPGWQLLASGMRE